MRPPRLALRPVRNAILGTDACVWCHTRQFLDRPTRRAALARPPKAPSTRRREQEQQRHRNPLLKKESMEQKPSIQQKAQRISKMMRNGLEMASAQGYISLPAREAEILLSDYQNTTLDELLERYDYALTDYSPLARLLVKVPEEHIHRTGVRLLIECSAKQDALATLCLTAMVRHGAKLKKSWTHHIAPRDISAAKSHLKDLAYKHEYPDAMVLVGLDHRDAKNDAAARLLFESAMRKVSQGEAMDLNSGMLTDVVKTEFLDPLPIPPPWIALGHLLLEQAEPDLEAAKAVFRMGAQKADDPLAYFYLAECEDAFSDEWLEYMTKAAVSGYPNAMFNLGNFYLQDPRELDKAVGRDGRRLLKAIDGFKQWNSKGFNSNLGGFPEDMSLSGREAMAFEWYWLSCKDDHKPGMLALARLLREKAAWWPASELIRNILRDGDVLDMDEDLVAIRDARALSRFWQQEEEKHGLTFMQDAMASLGQRR